MPKRKHPFFADPLNALKQNAPRNVSHASRKGEGCQSESKEHFAYQGWDHLEDVFEQNLSTDSEVEWMEQASISSVSSQPECIPPFMNSFDDKEDNVEILTQSSALHFEGERTSDNKDADSCINSVCSPSVSYEHPSGSQESVFSVECFSDNESLIIVNASRNSDKPFIVRDPREDISDQSILMTPSPNLRNEAFHFSSQTSESDHSLGMDQQESNHESETASISSGSASPDKQNRLKGSEWLQSLFSKMTPGSLQKLDAANTEVEVTPNECFKKISVVKDGLAEKLENILLDLKAEVSLQRKKNSSGNSEKLQIKIHNVAVFSVCHVVADCEKVVNSTASSSKVELNIPAGHTLAVVLTKNLVQRWTICSGCVLSILPTWQIMHVTALRKSFILCPSVIDVYHSNSEA